MDIFLKLYSTIIPYLCFIPIGYVVQQRNWIPKAWVAKPLLFVLMPILVIDHVLEAKVGNLLTLSIITFIMALAMNIPGHWVHKKFAQEENRSLLKSGFSFFNVAFFGIPTVSALFGQKAITTLICIYIGSAIYGNVIGYIQVAKTRFSTKKSIIEVFKVPFLYALALAIILKAVDFHMPEGTKPVIDWIGKVASAMGMLILGMNITQIDFKKLRVKYYTRVLVSRTVAAVLIMAVLMLGEYYFLDTLDKSARQVLVLIPLFPIAANLTLFASFLRSQERQSALLVLFSTVLSLILVPIVALVFKSYF